MAGLAARLSRRQGTPGRLRRMLTVILAATVLLWITATILLQGLHGAVQSVRDRGSPAFLDAIEAQAALSDADRAAWQSFRSGAALLTGPGPQYQNGITTASQDLQRLAALEPSGGAASQQLQTVSGQLVTYQGLVEQADAAYRTDVALGTASGHDLGHAYLIYASSSMRDPQGGLLTSVHKLAMSDQRALDRELARPWANPALLLVVVAADALVLGSIIVAQRSLQRRFRRMISPPLLLAVVFACGMLAWMALVILPAEGAFTAARGTALPKLTGIWQAQIRAVDREAAVLRDNSAGSGSGAASGGLNVTAAQRASSVLDADLASAEDTGGLPIGIPAVAAAVVGLAYLGIKLRLDEYRG
jgi:hypothetical protein